MTRLSLCLVTRNRADFIGETLDSVLPQLNAETELLIVDGASTDATPGVIRDYAARYPALRYHLEQTNSGIDGDYDKAVGYARGDYCWLLPDDDLLKPGAVARVIELLQENPDLVAVDAEVKNVDLSHSLLPRRLSWSGIRRYTAADADRFMVDVGEILSFIGCVIIRRAVWEERDRRRFYGSYFVHAGVIFQKPLDSAIICGEPLMTIRYGNSTWTPRRFPIWAFKWPQLILDAKGYSESAKRVLVPRPAWRDLRQMISFRARGAYGYHEYRQFFSQMGLGPWRALLLAIALTPGWLVHVLGTAQFALKGRILSPGAYELVRCSPHANRLSNWLARRAGLTDTFK
jgi:glycosyltransferase involved in cell wall biosynthesis